MKDRIEETEPEDAAGDKYVEVLQPFPSLDLLVHHARCPRIEMHLVHSDMQRGNRPSDFPNIRPFSSLSRSIRLVVCRNCLSYLRTEKTKTRKRERGLEMLTTR